MHSQFWWHQKWHLLVGNFLFHCLASCPPMLHGLWHIGYSQPGPAFSRLDRLLPIGPRAKGGPTLHLPLAYANLHFLLNCLCSAGVGATAFEASGGNRPHVNHSELLDFNSLNHDNPFFNLTNAQTENFLTYVYNIITEFSHPHSSAPCLSSALHVFLVRTSAYGWKAPI